MVLVALLVDTDVEDVDLVLVAMEWGGVKVTTGSHLFPSSCNE